ncbi:hypothetical protein [Deinococcus petrolearius]|uniref:HTH domain-containing protein n=1 Tax=Deinococcus petrolearius TaxID=1751295 RepID=A0ABW1DGZ2_9DEIO
MPRPSTTQTPTDRLTARVTRRLLAEPGRWTAAELADELGETRTRVARIIRAVTDEWGATYTPGARTEQRITLLVPDWAVVL